MSGMSGPINEARTETQWTITLHAINRYIDRVEPRATFEQAISALKWQLDGAHYVKTLDSGLELWRGPKPRRLRFRVRRGERLELVTVIETFDGLQRNRGKR